MAHLCSCGAHAWATLTKGFVTLVSPHRIGLLQDHRWFTKIDGRGKVCAARTEYPGKKTVRLHRVIVDAAGLMMVDHINRCPVDNRDENLRPATASQNAMNRPGRGDLPKGVAREGNRYKARIGVDGKMMHLGFFDTPQEAHAAYARAVTELHSSFACLEGAR
jgi:hypothetical protein